MNHSKRFLIRCSANFNKTDDKAIGRYEVTTFGGLSCFNIGMTLWIFQDSGILPVNIIEFMMSRKYKRVGLLKFLKKEYGMPSSPGEESLR